MCHPTKNNFRKMHGNTLCSFGRQNSEESQKHIFTNCKPVDTHFAQLSSNPDCRYENIFSTVNEQTEVIQGTIAGLWFFLAKKANRRLVVLLTIH